MNLSQPRSGPETGSQDEVLMAAGRDLPAQERLQQSRNRLRAALLHGTSKPNRGAFPRSTTMRLLVGVCSEFALMLAEAAARVGVPGPRGMLRRLPLAALIRLALRQYRPRAG